MRRSLFTRWMKPAKTTRPVLVRPQLVALEGRDVPATFTVNSLIDAAPVADGVLTLREAMTALNAGNGNALSATEKTLVTGTYGTNDTVNLAGVNGTITLIGVLNGIKATVITGPGADKLTINGSGSERHFYFGSTGTTNSISGVTLAGGRAGSGGSVATDNGAILTIADAVLTNNSASDGGAIWSGSTTGGGLTILRSTLANNTASIAGGGIWARTDVAVEASTVSGNLSNSTLFGGGGIVFSGNTRTRTIANTTFANNKAIANGGAIALESADGSIQIRNSTLAGNTAGGPSGGGGIARIGGNATIDLVSSIVANNTASATVNEDVFSAGTVTAVNSALSTTSGISTFAAGGTTAGLVGQNFKLAALAKNGGPVATVAIAADSPLVNAGSNPVSLTTDNRSTFFARVVNGAADVGAYEVQSLAVSVSTTADVVDGNYASGQFSLREALQFTNANPEADTIGFSSGYFSAGTTITLTAGELAITGPTTIQGPAVGTITVSGNNASRVFNTSGNPVDSAVILKNLTVTAGKSTADGGAIFVGDEVLTLIDSVVSNSSTAGDGGGITVDGPGTITLLRTTISGNTAASSGGGVYFFYNGNFSATDSAILNNKAGSTGGGVYFFGDGANTLTVRNTTISGNSGTSGGGIVLIAPSGGSNVGTLTLQNSTVINNTASSTGGGIAFVGSTNATIIVESSIVSGNVNAAAPDISSGKAVTVNFSAIGSATGFSLTGGNNLPFGTDLKLGALGNNGGPTLTHLPAVDSPVRDAGSNPATLSTDARGAGFPRLRNATADIGAVEAPVVLVVRSIADAGRDSLRQQVLDANTLAGSDTITFDPAAFASAKTITLTTGEIVITDLLTVTGPGADKVIVSGNASSRIFHTAALPRLAPVTISGLRLTDGRATMGAAVFGGDELLTLLDVVVTGNTASIAGGGVHMDHAGFGYYAGALVVRRATFSGNSAGAGGGGIDLRGNTLTLIDSTISGNSATNNGGGINMYGETENNSVVRNSTFTGNTAATGAAFQFSPSTWYNPTLSIQNATISGNTATANSAGIRIDHGGLAVESSVISGNVAPAAPDVMSGGPVTVNTSAIGDATGFTLSAGSGNLPTGLDLKLGVLQDNGGSTATMLPAVDSPLRGKGSNPAALTTDQRGFPRGGLSGVDIGAAQLRTTSVAGIVRTSAATTAATSVSWTVTLPAAVTGLTAANFVLTGGTSATITGVSGSGTTYTVTAATGTDGPLALTFANALGLSHVPTNLPFTGEAYVVDKTPLSVTSIALNDLLLTDADVGPGKFKVTATFSEPPTSASVVFPGGLPDALFNPTFEFTSPTTLVATYSVADTNLHLANSGVFVQTGIAVSSTAYLTIDTRNPTVASITRNNPASTNFGNVGWTVTFSEPVTGVGAANFSLVNGGLTGTPVITTVTGSGSTYVVTATTGGGEGTLALQLDTVANAKDLNGNLLAALPVNGGAYRVDHTAPAASKLTLNTLLIRDSNVGPNGFTASLKFNEPMDQTVAPTVSFPAEFPNSLTFNGGVWLDAQTYQAKFNVADLGVEQQNIDLRFSGAKDVVGNIQSEFTAADVFDIDTRNAVVATITSASPNGTYTAGQTIDVTLNFSEDVELIGTLNVMLNTGAVVSIVGPMAGGSVSGTYTVAAGQSTADLTVTSIALAVGATLTDAAGNAAVLSLPTSNLADNAVIVVGSPATVTGLVVNNGQAQRSRLTNVTATFSQPVDVASLGLVRFVRASDGMVANAFNGVITNAPASGAVSSLTITFENTTNAVVQHGSLADGRWTLEITGVGYTSPTITRLFGDINGDGTVDGGTDFAVFAFRTAVNDPFDFNADGVIDGPTDFAQFGTRFGKTI